MAVFKNLKTVLSHTANAALLGVSDDFGTAFDTHKLLMIPTVEDLRILNANIRNLDLLRDAGVRIAAPFWRGESIIGGAWNTETGLSEFGFSVVVQMFEIGMIPDLSHASGKAADEILSLAAARKKPVIASHSNAFAVTPHNRNLDDGRLRAIAETGGVIGVNLYTPFLTDKKRSEIGDLLAHVAHIVRVAGRESVVFGTDFDGMDAPAQGIATPNDLLKIIDPMKKQGFTEADVDRLFYRNGKRFCTQYL